MNTGWQIQNPKFKDGGLVERFPMLPDFFLQAFTDFRLIALLLLPLEQPTVVNIQVIEDWKFIAMVLDRLFLWLFTIAVLGGTAWIILRAPSLYDMREPIDKQISGIPRLF